VAEFVLHFKFQTQNSINGQSLIGGDI